MELKQTIKAVKVEPSYGNIRVNTSQFPFLNKAEVGKKVTIEIECEVTALRKPDNWEISEGKLKPTDLLVEISIKNLKPCDSKEDKK
jgi:hypothetical protein